MSVAAIGLHLRHSPATGRRGIERPSSSLLLDSGRDSPDASGIEISLTLTTHHHDASKKLLHRAVLQENGYDTRDLRSKRLVADRGYDADALRGDLRSAGTMPVIPGRRTRKHPVRHDAARYKDRWRIEAASCRLKDFRRIATRYDKLATNFASAVALATIVAFWC